jgi:hypothetical protein
MKAVKFNQGKCIFPRSFRQIDKTLEKRFEIWEVEFKMADLLHEKIFQNFLDYYMVLEDLGIIHDGDKYDRLVNRMYELYYDCTRQDVLIILEKYCSNNIKKRKGLKFEVLTDFEELVISKFDAQL